MRRMLGVQCDHFPRFVLFLSFPLSKLSFFFLSRKMKRELFFAVALLLAFACADRPLKQKEIVQHVNSDPSIPWTATVHPRFEGYTVLEMRRMLGVPLIIRRNLATGPETSLPDSFDSRDQWPGCVGDIRDQGRCGSCWAFGAVEALSDRFCIGSGGKVKVVLAAEDLTSCDSSDDGCDGGWPGNAWSYFESSGCVTEACYPYEIPPCHHPCGEPLPTPSCSKTCKNGASWQGDKHYAQSSYSVEGEKDMMNEIYQHGPIEAAFEVYEDFPTYKSGVYKHTKGAFLGGHAIKIIGWGSLNGVPYWTVANSWNTDWGDNGYFKILRGSDECGIESNGVAGLAKI
eukprot:TRINITY_DN14_c0_g2_i2.p1 TRINITY_DN14_c0_g2~~TRINITY_DN14_c0_g2_i2.p1  ORF type:complete len:343 (-),score=65.54 TRINITY_DN14_c0_g2_i2:450-1478(-)